MRKQSKKLAARLRKDYYPAHSRFLAKPENRFCWICIARSTGAKREEIRAFMILPHDQSTLWLVNSEAKCTPSTETHHYAGRAGKLLDYEPYFVSSCRGCREFPHMFIRNARELDLIAPASLYNVVPPEARFRDFETCEDAKT